MIGPARRALLAGALSLPALQTRAADAPLATLRVLVAAEGLRDLSPILAEFAASRTDLLLELTTRQEEPAWVVDELAGEVRAGQPSADVVLTGIAGLALGSARRLWQSLPEPLRATSGATSTRLSRLVLPLAEDVAVVITAGTGGPLLLHRQSAVADPPRSAAALLDYARQNPDRFLYPRPSESLLGQEFLMVLPHLLGDRDPADARTGWSRSWAWLEEMDRHVPYYPSTGTAALEEFSEGGIDLLPAPLATFLRERTTGLLPEDTAFATFEDGPLIPHGLFLAVPQHVPADHLAAVEALARFLMGPGVQTRAFGRGLLRGNPEFSAAGAGLLTEEERASWARSMPPDSAARLAARPLAAPLGPMQMAFMLRHWDERIGARHGDAR